MRPDFAGDTVRPIRVLIADDHVVVRQGLAALLASEGFDVVGEAPNGEVALRLLAERQPDIALVDLRMTPMDGCEIARAIRERDERCKVIILSAHATEDEVFRCLQTGALSYLTKDTDTAALFETIRSVHAGKRVINPRIAERLGEHVGGFALTSRQIEVLSCIAQGMSNQEIAESLGVTVGTVKSHVKAILKKLHVRDRTQAVMSGIRRGLVPEPAP